MGPLEFAGTRVAQVCVEAERRLAEVRARLVAVREEQVRHAPAARELAEFARTPGAPAALRAVQRRVDRAELTWEQVVLGGGAPDPEVHAVRAMLGLGLAPMPATVRRAREQGREEGGAR